MLCDFLRKQWLAKRATFTFETVMSHESKLEILRQARLLGYRTYMYFVCTDDAEINRRRVSARERDGGHGVSRGKIIARYRRSLNLLPRAIALCDRAYLFDNSEAGEKGHRWVAEFERGKLIRVSREPPGWLVRALRAGRKSR